MSDFWSGFEKQAILAVPVAGALTGYLAGGEKDKKTGEIKNRNIGAGRGLAASVGAIAGGIAGHSVSKRHLGLPGALVGGALAYNAAKRYGHKYDEEKNAPSEKRAYSMTQLAGGLGHAATALRGRAAQGLAQAKTVAGGAFERAMAQPAARQAAQQTAQAATGAAAGAAKKAAKPQPGFLTKARIYGKGAVAGGAITAAGFGVHKLMHGANQGAMQPMAPGYY